MSLSLDKLKTQLKARLAPLYLVSGEDILLLQEASEAIRTAAAHQDFRRSKLWHVDKDFDWGQWFVTGRNRSLFSAKQLIELRSPYPIPKLASHCLQSYAEYPTPHQILLITCGRLDTATQQMPWFKTWLRTGVFCPIWPLELNQWPGWIGQRLAKASLQTDTAGVNALIELTEGNLAASAQAIEKLRLSYGPGFISVEHIKQEISDNARFNPFKLADAALQGEGKRCLRILSQCRKAGIEPSLILWTLVNTLRQLATSLYALAQGQALTKVFAEQNILARHQSGLQHALQRRTLEDLPRLFTLANRVDRVHKGIEAGQVWDTLLDLSLGIAASKNRL